MERKEHLAFTTRIDTTHIWEVEDLKRAIEWGESIPELLEILDAFLKKRGSISQVRACFRAMTQGK